jgi:hypothetical protein
MPARLTPKDYTIVADLDAIIAEPMAFKLGGKAYEIIPVKVEDFVKLARSLDQIRKLLEERKEGKDITDDHVTEAYFSFFSPLCPQLTLSDVRKMNVVQLHALLQLFIRHFTGQDITLKKKLPT